MIMCDDNDDWSSDDKEYVGGGNDDAADDDDDDHNVSNSDSYTMRITIRLFILWCLSSYLNISCMKLLLIQKR